MPYTCQFGGAGYLTAPTLGNLISANKLRILSQRVRMPSSGGFLYSQTGATAATREFGILFNAGELRYIYGSGTERLLFTTAELNAIAGTSAPWQFDSVDFRFDATLSTVEIYINGTLRKTVALVKGTGRINGMLFRLGARSNNDTTDTSGGFITPSGTQVGDTDIFIDDVLVRRYITPSAGTTIPDSVGGNDLTQRGTWPANNDEWIFYSSGATYQLTALGGTFSYSGGQASLLRQFRLQALGATYAYSGAPANLTYVPTGTVYTLTALGGSFAYSGGSANVRANRKLIAQGGNYNYSGGQASLLRRFRLVANGGAYAYAGGSANLTYNQLPGVYRLTALGATYTYTGGIAALTAIGVTPTANPGAYVIQAYVGGTQTISAKIGGRQTINAMVAI